MEQPPIGAPHISVYAWASTGRWNRTGAWCHETACIIQSAAPVFRELPHCARPLTHALSWWLIAPITLFAGIAAWLRRRRRARWHPISLDWTNPAKTPNRSGVEPAPTSLPPVPGPLAPTLAQGADLAARARFVAMSFTLPQAGWSRHGPTDWPLHMECEPTRFTLTLGYAVLSYCLELCNRGAEALGPLMIRAELVAAESRTAPDEQAEFACAALPPCHYLDSLPAGENVALTGELRLSLGGVVAMRLGLAELLVPLMRVCAESARESRLALSLSACFAIGLPPLAVGGGIQPFRLDSGPGIWRKLTVRRLNFAQYPSIYQLPLDGGHRQG
jgi:hypothetical protein